jgi:hypothetical protein
MRNAIDAQRHRRGRRFVIAHHPHVLQGVEWYNGKLVVYSLGNFIFDQAHRGDRRGVMRARGGSLSLARRLYRAEDWRGAPQGAELGISIKAIAAKDGKGGLDLECEGILGEFCSAKMQN